MEKVKIALIDSGINANYLKKCEIINIGDFNSYHDDIFHGTVCAYLINEIIEDGQIYNLKVFDKNMHTSSRKLLKAISWCIENNMDIINISISITDMNYYYEFREICDKAFKKGCIIVAAANNAGFFSLPAYMQTVCGVGTARLLPDQFIYKENSQIQYYTNGINPFSPENVKFHHSSFATARITGLLGKFLQENVLRGLNALEEFNELTVPLNENLLHVNYKRFDFEANTSPVIINRCEINEKLSGMRIFFWGLTRECRLLKEYTSCVEFDDIIPITESFDRQLPIREKIRIALITGKIPEVTLDKAEWLNENIDTYSLFPIKNYNNKKIKYLFDNSISINSFIENMNNDHIFMNRKLNLLLLNFAYTDILTLELFLVNLIEKQKHDTALISNNPLSVLFGFDFLEKDVVSLNNLATYIKVLVETYNQEEKQYVIMSTDSPYRMQNKNFENDFITFTSLVFSFSPDKILFVIDKFTAESHLEQALKYLKGFINAPIVAIIYIDFDEFFDYNSQEIVKNKQNTIKESVIYRIDEMFKKYDWGSPNVVNFSDREQMQKIKFFICAKD
ncbi:MAG: S8 family serine peptidase [Bacteroidales bacterium]|jgi:hypothetical protein|nr:S8 family serine peptidase [Bacteroidales bacterium]